MKRSIPLALLTLYFTLLASLFQIARADTPIDLTACPSEWTLPELPLSIFPSTQKSLVDPSITVFNVARSVSDLDTRGNLQNPISPADIFQHIPGLQAQMATGNFGLKLQWQISSPSKSWVAVPQNYFPNFQFSAADLAEKGILPNSQIRYIISVSKRNCSGSGNFNSQVASIPNYDTVAFNSKIVLDAINKKAYDAYGSVLANYQLIESISNSLQNRVSNFPSEAQPLQTIPVAYDDFGGGVDILRISAQRIFSLDGKCASSSVENQLYTSQIKFNYLPCSLGFSINVDGLNFIYGIKTVAKKNSSNMSVINCSKGKATKSVSGVKPVCPPGYKKV